MLAGSSLPTGPRSTVRDAPGCGGARPQQPRQIEPIILSTFASSRSTAGLVPRSGPFWGPLPIAVRRECRAQRVGARRGGTGAEGAAGDGHAPGRMVRSRAAAAGKRGGDGKANAKRDAESVKLFHADSLQCAFNARSRFKFRAPSNASNRAVRNRTAAAWPGIGSNSAESHASENREALVSGPDKARSGSGRGTRTPDPRIMIPVL